jgi:predicted phage tail protein
LVGAAGGAAFAVLALIAFAITPGPASASGVDVIEYYTDHGHVAIWQAVLGGLALVCFLWFAATFASATSASNALSPNAVLVTAGVVAAVYLVALGAWEALAETYQDVDIVDVPSEQYSDAHILYDVGVGAAHMAGFADAAFVGATAAALLTAARPSRRLGLIGVALTTVFLVNAPFQIFAHSDWSGDVGAVVFVCLLAWVFALSVVLVVSLRREGAPATDLAPG